MVPEIVMLYAKAAELRTKIQESKVYAHRMAYKTKLRLVESDIRRLNNRNSTDKVQDKFRKLCPA